MQGTKTDLYCEKYARHKKTITGDEPILTYKAQKAIIYKKEYRKVVS
jgi:hypothetical protein|nr:MAG TPA: hypothetical protein [Caudoviricetes sp.]